MEGKNVLKKDRQLNMAMAFIKGIADKKCHVEEVGMPSSRCREFYPICRVCDAREALENIENVKALRWNER